ncbi:CGNR zinc finger domain-containing protein [Paenibacillus sp. sptzw28]|uniref:CGNR zinc finger domain-containing protein n=1 Tax=Paenibacillus sp. sptzw28 TaxID=715179 RepID=UPI001C6E6929|nr:CGNR zinc finger domain-containing protein [Paenibacillus sp. sptzw28]QYR23303.1 CGNR zinc finger domain-containing protein [Paenibacillus sp. sptzw28]
MDSALYLLGGSIWVNLVNTRFMQNKQPQDVLTDRTKALLWLEANHLLKANESGLDPDTLDRVCTELASLRELCMVILSALEQHGRPTGEIILSLQERAARLSLTAVIDAGKERLSLTYEGKNTVDYVLNRIIRSIFDTLDTYSPERIRQCEHEECILYFVDTSKSGKRRWCSMETCGNRYKAAEFYAKKRKGSMESGPADPN